jgi:agmatinase
MLTDGAHPEFWIEPATMNIADIGDLKLALGDIPASLQLIEQQVAGLAHLIALGGEHGITLPLLRALSRRVHGHLALVHFDAHVDTWPDNFGQTYAHGSVFYHAIEERLIEPRRMIQIGIRSPVQREVWDWTIGQGVTVLTAQDAHAMGADVWHSGFAPWSERRRPISASTWTRSIRPSHRAPGRRRSAA